MTHRFSRLSAALRSTLVTHRKRTSIQLCALVCSGVLVACSAYKPDVVQGNIVKAEQVEELRTGLTRVQVQQILGTPMLQDIFNTQRWDYVYRVLTGDDRLEQRALTVFFDANNKLSHWTGQYEPTQTPTTLPAFASASAPASVTLATLSQANELPSNSMAQAPAIQTALVTASAQELAPAPKVEPRQANPAPVVATASMVEPKVPAALRTSSASIGVTSSVQAPALSGAAKTAATPSAALPATTTALGSVEQQILARLDSWKKAWIARDVNRYLAHYAATHQGDFASPAAWAAQRKRVLNDAGEIQLNLNQIAVIQTASDAARVRFTQQYKSQRLSDTGEKELFLKLDKGQWLIVSERFVK